MAFVHLRTHTEYSVVDGTLRVDDAVRAAQTDAQVALAITDLANLFGAVKFFRAARKRGVQPLIGVDVWLEPPGGDGAAAPPGPPAAQASRLLLLVQNAEGYLNVSRLLSQAWVHNVQRSNQAWVSWDALAAHAAGLIALSGAEFGRIGQALMQGDRERAREHAQALAALFPQRLYLEVQRAGAPHHEPLVRATAELAAQLGLPLVATQPVQFLAPEDFEAHEARVCVAEGQTLDNPRRVRRFTREQYLKTQAQMQALFADLPSALANTVQVARRCAFEMPLGKPKLPAFPTPALADGSPMPMADYFRQRAHEGLDERLALLYPDPGERAARRGEYAERLEFEIATILKMDFPGYFLIVADFIGWARAHGCPVGPGRGSGAGSLVAYALGITDLDPLRYQLLFERFLNPERVSMPDFDIDFCQANRDRVIDYVKQRYGLAAVSQIVTFGTMAAKAALRDVGRVLGMGYGHVDSIAKLIPAPPGKTVTLAPVPAQPDDSLVYARKEAPELGRREEADEEVAELLKLATRVEGIVRNIGMHAGGVLIAPGEITDFCPLYQQPGSDAAVSQFDKDDVEAMGLVKFDFLGLATLTILELAKDFIRAGDPERADFDYAAVPLDDASVYKLFAQGLTEAVFQFESRGMQGMLRDAQPTRLEDLIALNAMFRPGPMENIPSFCARKNGREEVSYPHPLLEPVLAETYGIFVYQEQVMQAAQILGAYSLGGADLLRRAMGKKKAEEMAEHRAIFRQGAAGKGIAEAKADEIFDLMEKFAGYGFNKSHAAAYSLLAYHTGWVKRHHPAEFYAANMTVEMGDTDKLRVLIKDAQTHFGIRFELPDINAGAYRFEPLPGPAGSKAVRYGLGAVKGTGQGAIESIVAERQRGGAFASLFDFSARVDRGRVNKRVVEALIKAGAFDALHADRARTLASVSLAFDWADAQAAAATQGGLFDGLGADAHGAGSAEPPLAGATPWGPRERLLVEKTALGFHLSGHLFDEDEDEVRQFCPQRIEALLDSREPQQVAGIVGELRVIDGQRGKVGIFKLDDRSDVIEVVVTQELLLAQRELLQEDALVVVQGQVKVDRFAGGLRLNATALWDLAGARARFGRFCWVDLEPGALHAGVAGQIIAAVQASRPHVVDTPEGEVALGLPLRVRVRHASGTQGDVDLGPASRLWPSNEALQRLRQLPAAPGSGVAVGVAYGASRPRAAG